MPVRSRQRRPTVPLEAQDSGPMGARPQEQLVVDAELTPARGLRQKELTTVIRKALDQLN